MSVIVLAALVAVGLPLAIALIAWFSQAGLIRERPRSLIPGVEDGERYPVRPRAREPSVTFLLPVAAIVVASFLVLAAINIGHPLGMGGDMNQMMRGMMSAGASAATSGSASGSGDVQIKNFSFQPSQMTVTVGTVIRWTNEDSVPHTVTARDGSFDSGRLDKGQSFEHRFDKPGVIDYYCVYHPNMTARIKVVSATQ